MLPEVIGYLTPLMLYIYNIHVVKVKTTNWIDKKYHFYSSQYIKVIFNSGNA